MVGNSGALHFCKAAKYTRYGIWGGTKLNAFSHSRVYIIKWRDIPGAMRSSSWEPRSLGFPHLDESPTCCCSVLFLRLVDKYPAVADVNALASQAGWLEGCASCLRVRCDGVIDRPKPDILGLIRNMPTLWSGVRFWYTPIGESLMCRDIPKRGRSYKHHWMHNATTTTCMRVISLGSGGILLLVGLRKVL